MIRLRDYQEDAIQDLISKSHTLMDLGGTQRLVFKAPTGSGKTIMMAEYLKRLAEGGGAELAFIWTAPRKLHLQSKEKLDKYFEDSRALKCVEFEELNDRQIGANEILFFNWEHVRQENNVFIRENEQDFNLSRVLERTREVGRMIVLVIDEAHYAASTDAAAGIIRMIQPALVVDVSATPQLQGDEMVSVQRKHVIDEGMIKKQAAINPGFRNLLGSESRAGQRLTSSASQSTDEAVLAEAIARRERLKKGFEDSGSSVNPLLLIQIPDRQAGELFDRVTEIVRILNTQHGISVENGKLAIYLSENKENLENITRNDSEAEVMIFKQAIALGWDCQRASILCLFRDWQDFVFSTQTLGRILRMPELKHYENKDLNTAYIYTTVSDLSVLEDVASDYLTIQHAARKLEYEPLALRSVHSKRRRERTRLNPEYLVSFAQAAGELDLKGRLDIAQRTVTRTLLVDGWITNADEEIADIRDGDSTVGYHAGQMERELGNEEIQRVFDQFCAQSLAPDFFPEARSVGRVKAAIYQFFELAFPGQFKRMDSEIQKIVLDHHNLQKVRDAINRAKEIYQAALDTEEKELLVHTWEVPPSFDYKAGCTEKEYRKSIMQPFYERNDAPAGEKRFADYLDRNPTVLWWYKNGDRDQTFFAVPYELNGEPYPFYVDWIVKFTDGRVGLFDTKAGLTASSDETKAKAEGLRRYISEENEKRKNLIGGIVVERGESWRVNDLPEYHYDDNDLSGWKFFENL